MKEKKQVDRRASKNRKIRYLVHEKIVNFMTPMDNLQLLGGGDEGTKDSIVQTLFGSTSTKRGADQKRERLVPEFDDIKLI